MNLISLCYLEVVLQAEIEVLFVGDFDGGGGGYLLVLDEGEVVFFFRELWLLAIAARSHDASWFLFVNHFGKIKHSQVGPIFCWLFLLIQLEKLVVWYQTLVLNTLLVLLPLFSLHLLLTLPLPISIFQTIPFPTLPILPKHQYLLILHVLSILIRYWGVIWECELLFGE